MRNGVTYSRIMGAGHYVPPRVVTNFDVMKMMETSDEFIVQRTGVRRRRHAEPEVGASDLAVSACRAAVENAGLQMQQIDFLIMNTITPDHADPGCAFFLQHKLGLAGIGVLDIRQQCAGLIYGLSVADHFIRAGTYRHVLVACSEVLSKRIDGSYDGRNIAILLGDGAGAVVVGPSDDRQRGILSTILHADGSYAKALYTAAPGSALGRSDHIAKEDIDAGTFTLKGELPVNSDGGLKSFGHPIGASGLRMTYEVYKQLQGKAEQPVRQLKDPKLGLAHTLGGRPEICCVAIFGKDLG